MKPVRCAIYTRKSSDEGLEQDFNSLDAQREACAAYVLSQASEGWTLLPDTYDDGGISGGTLERPALQRLLAAVAAGQIDIVVLYKIDRLTRSLLDFARLVEAFEQAGTSFVSVTQSFNTTTSMGRLTLNMLLSFAQFEREVTAERIRDKVAASKAKGMWMGGIPPLGYRPDGRSLRIVEPHAALIRDIHARYRRLRNVRLVADELADAGIRTPVRKLASGRNHGGTLFSRGQIHAILKNPVYVGDIAHRGTCHRGLHPAIIARDEWEEVQAMLKANVKGQHPATRKASPCLLAGKLVDEAGQPMLATHACKGERRYRYYVSKRLHLAHGDAAGRGLRVPAAELEAAVASELARLFDDPLTFAERTRLEVAPDQLMGLVAQCRQQAEALRSAGLGDHLALLARVQLSGTQLAVEVATAALAKRMGLARTPHAPAGLTLTRELRFTRTGRAIRLVQDNGAFARTREPDPSLVALLLRARDWWARLRTGAITPTELAAQEQVTVSYVTRVVRAAFLAPTVVEGLLAGRQQPHVNTRLLLKPDAIPIDWKEQEAQLLAG